MSKLRYVVLLVGGACITRSPSIGN